MIPRKSRHFTTSAAHLHEKDDNGNDADDYNDDDDDEDDVDDDGDDIHKDKKKRNFKRMESMHRHISTRIHT